MNTLKITLRDRLAFIALDRGKSNAMNAEMLTELHDMVRNIEQDENTSGVLLTGKENFFSAGLDLLELYEYNEDQSRAFWRGFLNMLATLVSFKKPMVAAINGHSPAGGAVLALCCDYRVMAEGKFVIGLNEVPVGIIIPDVIFQLYAFWTGQRRAAQYLLEGKLVSPQEALEVGMVDELASPESIISTAERKVRTYMGFEANTWSQSKLNIRRGLILSAKKDQTDVLTAMLKQWWSPGTRANLKAIIDNLKRK